MKRQKISIRGEGQERFVYTRKRAIEEFDKARKRKADLTFFDDSTGEVLAHINRDSSWRKL